MKYSMNGVPAAAEISAAISGDNTPFSQTRDNIIKLNINAAVKAPDGETLARLVQEGFSEIAITTGGKVYEY